MAKEFQAEMEREAELGLNPDEVAFYDALVLRCGIWRTSSKNSSDNSPIFGLSNPQSANTSATPLATTALSF
jgi:hypothetical protein